METQVATDKAKEIAQLHGIYQRLSRMEIKINMERERLWFEWLRHGFTALDLGDVIAHLQREIRAGKRNPGSLKFSNMIGRPDLFEEDLQLARALGRTPKVDAGRAEALRATGRTGKEVGNIQHSTLNIEHRTAKSAGEVIQGLKPDSSWQVGWEAMKQELKGNR